MPETVRLVHRVVAGAAGAALVVTAGIAARAPGPVAGGAAVRVSRPLMGTMFEVSVWASPGREPRAAEAAGEVLDLAAALEASISEWRPTSETSAVNAAAGTATVEVGTDLRELVARSIEWAGRTEGALDVTGGPLFELWERARVARTLPSVAEIGACRALVGHDKVRLVGTRVGLAEAGMKLGFGAIGKGFAADRMAQRLRGLGFPDFIVDAGGDLVVGGSQDGRPWVVGVRDPRRDAPLATLLASDYAVATSGDYERFFVASGVRYSHILDLRTGWPVREVTSVTAIAQSGTDADALATALTVLGWERGLALANALDRVEALIVDDLGRVHLSKGLRLEGDRLQWAR